MLQGSVPSRARRTTDDKSAEDEKYIYEPFNDALDSIVPFLPRDAYTKSKEYLKPLARRLMGLSYWRDWDKLSNK